MQSERKPHWYSWVSEEHDAMVVWYAVDTATAAKKYLNLISMCSKISIMPWFTIKSSDNEQSFKSILKRNPIYRSSVSRC
jgi:hypothetical protein